MADIPTLKRQLKIKASVAKRLDKEHKLYRKEAEDNRAKLDKLRAAGVPDDEWDVKNASKIIDESDKMILDSSRRLSLAVGELRDLVASTETVDGLVEDVDFVAASAVLKQVNLEA